MNVRLEWLNVFADNEETLDQYFEHLGKQFYELYRILQASQPIRFALSARQQEQFNSFFAQVQKEYSNLFGLDIVASVRRLGLITFRIAMILTSLRIIDGGQISNLIVCDDSDYHSSIIMARVLLQHTAKVFGSLPTTESNAPNGQTVIRQTFLDNLPPEFDRKTYLAVAEKLKIPPKTAEKYISRFCVGGQLKHLAHDSYGKPYHCYMYFSKAPEIWGFLFLLITILLKFILNQIIFVSLLRFINIKIQFDMTDEKSSQLNRLKVVLAEQNRSGKWLAEQLGKTDTTVSRWVQNKVQPSVEQLFDIAKVLGVEAKDLINYVNK